MVAVMLSVCLVFGVPTLMTEVTVMVIMFLFYMIAQMNIAVDYAWLNWRPSQKDFIQEIKSVLGKEKREEVKGKERDQS